MFPEHTDLYHPEQGAGSTVITFKFDGEEKSYDLSDPEQHKEAVKDIELGNLHKKQQHKMAEELKAVKSKAELYEQFEDMMQGVREGRIEPKRLIDAISLGTGLELTVKEKEQIASGDFFGEDSKMVEKLYKEVESLKDEIKKSQADVYWETKRDATHTKLQSKFSGGDGKPAYDPEEVEAYCKKEGIFRKDLERQYETAYLEMHDKEIREAELKAAQKREQEKLRKKDAFLSNDDGYDFSPGEVKTDGKNYNQLVEETLRLAKEQGVQIITDD